MHILSSRTLQEIVWLLIAWIVWNKISNINDMMKANEERSSVGNLWVPQISSCVDAHAWQVLLHTCFLLLLVIGTLITRNLVHNHWLARGISMHNWHNMPSFIAPFKTMIFWGGRTSSSYINHHSTLGYA